MTRFRMTCAVTTAVLAGLAVYTTVGAEHPEEKTSGARVRVGTFDSRAVAGAYYGSNAFRDLLKGLTAEHEKAKAAGDKKRAKELELDIDIQHRNIFEAVHRI